MNKFIRIEDIISCENLKIVCVCKKNSVCSMSEVPCKGEALGIFIYLI